MGTTDGGVNLSGSLAVSVPAEGTPSAAQAVVGLGLEPGELAQVFSRYGVLVVRWAERIFRDGVTADDVLHEVMLRMLSHGRTFLELPTEGQRRAWLYRTTMRTCWSMKSRGKRARERAEQSVALEADSASPSAAERQLLDKLCASLQTEERILAVMYFEEGYTKMEIHEMTRRSRPFIDKKLAHISSELERLGGGEA